MADKEGVPLPDDFRLGEAEVSPGRRLIRFGGRETRVEPKAMAVLEALAAAAPNPVSRNELLQQVWGDQVVREEVLTRCVYQLRKALQDGADHQGVIETIPRQGYRLTVAPESVVSAGLATPTETTSKPQELPPQASRDSRRFWRYAAALALVAAIGGLAMSGFFDGPNEMVGRDAIADEPPLGTPQPFTASIAVLPLRDLTADGKGNFLATGLSIELVHALTSVEGLRVIASASGAVALGIEGEPVDLTRRLGVENLLHGTVQVEGGKVRLILVLSSGATNESLWTRRYNVPFDELLAVQQTITEEVVAQIPGVMGVHTKTPAIPIDPKAYKDYLRARTAFAGRDSYYGSELHNKVHADTRINLDSYREAWSAIESALAKEPEFGPAHSLASGIWRGAHLFLDGVDREQSWAKAQYHAERAIEINPNDGRALMIIAELAERSGDRALAENAYRAGIRAQPGYAGLRLSYAAFMLDSGRIEGALAQILRAQDLNPDSSFLLLLLMQTYIFADDLEAAQATTRTAEQMGRILNPYYKIHRLARLGEWDAVQTGIESVWPTVGRDPSWVRPTVGYIKGDVDRAVALDAVTAGAASGDIDPVAELAAYVYMGEVELAIEQVAELLEMRHGAWYQVWLPAYWPVRMHPRFADLMVEYGWVAFWERFGWPDHCEPDNDGIRCW